MAQMFNEEIIANAPPVRYSAAASAAEEAAGRARRDGPALGALRRRAAAVLDAALTGDTLDLSRLAGPGGSRAMGAVKPPALPPRPASAGLPAVTIAADKDTLDETGREVERRGAVVRRLVLRGWARPVDTALRALSLRTAERVWTLDLSGSGAGLACFDVVRARFWALKTLDVSGCAQFDDACVRCVIGCANRTLTSLDVSRCPAMSVDAIGWLAGELGAGSEPSCSRLVSLRAGGNPRLDDRAWAYLGGGGLSTLRCLDVSDSPELTDEGVARLARGVPRLEVLDLRRSSRLTDDTLRCLGRRCPLLRSLGLTRLEWLTDRGLWALAQGCRRVQTLDVAGCPQVTELGLYFVAVRCPGLQRLRADGDSLVTSRGLEHLARGLGRGIVAVASRWHGLRPADGGPAKKLENQVRQLRAEAAGTVQRGVRGWLARRLGEKLRRRRLVTGVARHAAAVAGRRIEARRAEEDRHRRLGHDAAILLTVRGRRMVLAMRERRARRRREEEDAAARVLDRLKARLRGQRARRAERRVYEAVLFQRRCRRDEAAAMGLLGMQNLLREYQAHSTLGSLRWELFRRRWDLERAACTVQRAFRCWVARQRAEARRLALESFAEAVMGLATLAQRVWRGHGGRVHGRWMRDFGWHVVRASRDRSAALIQGLYRGLVGRRDAEMLRRAAELRNNAASRIQRVWRGSRVPSWQAIALDALRRRVAVTRDRRMLAGREKARVRREALRAAGRPDSASDEPSDDDWEEAWDNARGRWRWSSAARGGAMADRCPAWELERRLAAGRFRVLVYDDGARGDRQGRVTRWVPRKQRFKVTYDDGGSAYVALHARHRGVRVWWEGAWAPFAALPHGEWSPPGRRREGGAERGAAQPARSAGVFTLAARAAADA